MWLPCYRQYMVIGLKSYAIALPSLEMSGASFLKLNLDALFCRLNSGHEPTSPADSWKRSSVSAQFDNTLYLIPNLRICEISGL
jgi:hypothetical protein